MKEPGRLFGKVKFFSLERGYGFVTVEDTGQNVFVHRNDLQGVSIGGGDIVSFSLGISGKGPVCLNIQRLEQSTRA